MKKILFIDRDGTINMEAPPTYQVDSFEKLEFYPDVFYYLRKIATELDFILVMVTNQDGLGTPDYPESSFLPIQHFIITALENETIHFYKIHIDRTFPAENAPTRKPGTGMLLEYINNPDYDLANSFMIGDRITDMQLAKNLHCKGIWINKNEILGASEISSTLQDLEQTIVLKSTRWEHIYTFLKNSNAPD